MTDSYDGFVGKHGDYASVNDVYAGIKNSTVAKVRTLKPGIVVRDAEDNIHTVAFDDVVNGIRENFDHYNYNAAYSSHFCQRKH